MPLTDFQAEIGRLLAVNRSEDSYLAGGAALHLTPNSKRYSNDLDFFHDSEERVAEAFQNDRSLLEKNNYSVEINLQQPGFIRSSVAKSSDTTKIEWAHDSAWRFMPTVKDQSIGYLLHPIDLSVSKLLCLAGRDEPRDFVDILEIIDNILPLGALCWAAVGKDPGFTPMSLLELLKRRGRYRPEDFSRLQLTTTIDLPGMKTTWLKALESAESFVSSRPPSEVGCLYYSTVHEKFIEPEIDQSDVALHYGKPGGVLPKFLRSEN